jgi:hypothetical protein
VYGIKVSWHGKSTYSYQNRIQALLVVGNTNSHGRVVDLLCKIFSLLTVRQWSVISHVMLPVCHMLLSNFLWFKVDVLV